MATSTVSNSSVSYVPLLGAYPVLLGVPGAGTGAGSSVASTNEDGDFTTSSAYQIYYIDTTNAPVLVHLNPNPEKDEVADLWDKTGFAGIHPISLDGNGHTIAGQATVPNFIEANYGHAKVQFDGDQWLLH